MSDIIADTSALIAFFIRTEEHHGDARRYMAAHPNARWIVLESVFDETVTWFRARVSPQDSIVIGRVREMNIAIAIYQMMTTLQPGKPSADTQTKPGATPTARSSSWRSASASPKYFPSTSTSAR